MLKRLFALTLSLLLIVTMLPLTTSAAASKDQAMKNQIRTVYRKVQRMLGVWDLNGWCGLMTDYQLYALGVDTTLDIRDGNGQYDEYCNKQLSPNGYNINAYSAKQYTLEEVLNTISHGGTKDVYNILIGFQWTNTSAGRYYGHACVIHGIIDGKVYFVEGFATPLGGSAGNPIVCTIAQFANYYNSWCSFEGAIEFGTKVYTDFCQEYAANQFVETTMTVPLTTLPTSAENEQNSVLRQVARGERLWAVGLYKNTLGQFYYKVNDGGVEGYVPAEPTQLIQLKQDDLATYGFSKLGALKSGKDVTLSGSVGTKQGTMSRLEVQILDAEGNVLQTSALNGLTRMRKLSNATLNKAINFAKLKAGAYTYSVTATLEHNYLEDGKLQTRQTQVNLWNDVFTVGSASADSIQKPEAAEPAQKEGWLWENNAWYYYENGQYRTGWLCHNGINYYLNADGKAATGWQEINGKDRYFTATGAMMTGWVNTDQGTTYLLSNGVAAEGFREVDGKQYYFNDNGILQTKAWVEQDGQKYYMQEDGSMATGWVQISGSNKCFREDGRLYAEVVTDKSGTYIRIYEDVVTNMDALPNHDLQTLVPAGTNPTV